MKPLWITARKTVNSLCITHANRANNLWMTCGALAHNFVQLKPAFKTTVEQRVEQPVAKLVQQPSNKLAHAVHATRTVFEQLLETTHLFKTTRASSSASHPHCTSAKPLMHNSFSSLSTIY
jgi:hypothetical protein